MIRQPACAGTEAAQFQTMFCLILQRKQAKLVGEPKVKNSRFRPCAVSGVFSYASPRSCTP
ncbi:hypothetical protein C5O78_12735 [Treponema phagedenis]|nr:hypothetical protein C5O78_12735 [Treponema phagedenis]